MPGLLLGAADLAARRAAVGPGGPGGPLAPLAESLAADLDRVLAADVHVARRKARLTRAGGRCPAHGAEFVFDPFSPDRFRCDACGRDYAGDAHHEFWLLRYHLWLAERAVHAAALHAALGRPAYAAFAARVLAEASDAYPALPNRDNVLGPARPFFSTYLESLWLLTLCVALDLLEVAGGAPAGLGGTVRDRLVAPSRALVASYPEGRSNRQVWNCAAMLAAARLTGDAPGAEQLVHGPGGLADLVRDGLLADGTWYEGDNYHQFAHRGLWYGVTMAERAGAPLEPALAARFARGFAAPFLVAMPDLTLPARRDAQFGASLRQWRWAEWLELGVARGGPRGAAGDDPAGVPALAHWLRTLYDPAAPGGQGTGRWRASGEAERNEPPSRLTRADLGWKSLLFAEPELPGGGAPTLGDLGRPGSVLLPEQGLAILRGEGPGAYVSLDYGRPGGGHGHPDRLNVQRWPALVDPGTGSYVDPTLHWYRSTLAHAAPLVDERSQPPTTGRLLGFAGGPPGAPQGAAAEAEIAPGVTARRHLVLTREYLLDRLSWTGLGDRTLDLPIGGAIGGPAGADHWRGVAGAELGWRPAVRRGGGGLEDGFDFVADPEETRLYPAGIALAVAARELAHDHPGHTRAHVVAPPGAWLWRARAPGAPGRPPSTFSAVRARGDAGAVLVMWDFTGAVGAPEVGLDGAIRLPLGDGRSDQHRPPAHGHARWTVERAGPTARPQRWELALADAAPTGARDGLADVDAPPPGPPPGPAVALADGAPPLALALGRAHYRRTEASWEEAGRPAARVALAVRGGALHVAVDVTLGRPTVFAPPGAENPLDNERAGINGDGLQLHLSVAGGARAEPAGSWLLVPVVPGPAVDVQRTDRAAPPPGDAADPARPAATWAPTPGGWRLDAAIPLASVPAAMHAAAAGAALVLDVLVNEMPPGRERRRGQLVLGGLAGPEERAYLAGDRHDAGRGLRLALPAG